MALSKERIAYLLKVWTSRKATEAEEMELFNWINEKEFKEPLESYINRLVKEYNNQELLPAVDWEKLYGRVLEKRDSVVRERQRVHKYSWFKWPAAAAILLLVGGGIYFVLKQGKQNQPIAKVTEEKIANDITAPSVNK